MKPLLILQSFFYREVCGGGSRLLWNIFSKVLNNGKKK
jgi:hypothetical protein